MRLPSVSIVIPCFNSRTFLLTTIESCVVQEFIKEIIVVDDGSTDDSLEFVRAFCGQYPELIRVYSNPNKGGNNARRFGFNKSSGKVIQWLDADDILLPGKLQAQVSFLNQHPEVDIAYSDWQLDTYDGENLVRSEKIQSRSYDDYLHELLIDNWLPPHAYLMTRAMAQKCVDNNGWNPETRIAQDREFFTTAALLGARFGYVPGNFCIYNRFLQVSSVSRSLKPEQKAAYLVGLLNSFLRTLPKQTWISSEKRKDYEAILKTQILFNAAYYQLPLPEAFSPGAVKWSLIKGWRSRAKVLKRLLLKS